VGRPGLTHQAPRAVVVLWHGRGANEGHVLDALAGALHREGCTVVVPDWDHSAPDRGAAALRASLDSAFALADDHAVSVVVAGWSLGGTAALSLALSGSSARRPAAVVGLAGDTRARSPLDGTVPVERLTRPLDDDPPPLHLVHGRADTVVPVEEVLAFAEACRGAGARCTLDVVASDHAGVVGTAYDPNRGVCVPSDDVAATTGLTAAVRAVNAALIGSQTPPSP